MSADLWIKFPACETCGRGEDADTELNITYNLSRMLREAGFNGWDWCRDKPAPQVGTHMLDVLDRMTADPDHWRAMSPPNGWGDYDRCLQGRMRRFAEACVAAKAGVIEASL